MSPPQPITGRLFAAYGEDADPLLVCIGTRLLTSVISCAQPRRCANLKIEATVLVSDRLKYKMHKAEPFGSAKLISDQLALRPRQISTGFSSGQYGHNALEQCVRNPTTGCSGCRRIPARARSLHTPGYRRSVLHPRTHLRNTLPSGAIEQLGVFSHTVLHGAGRHGHHVVGIVSTRLLPSMPGTTDNTPVHNTNSIAVAVKIRTTTIGALPIHELLRSSAEGAVIEFSSSILGDVEHTRRACSSRPCLFRADARDGDLPVRRSARRLRNAQCALRRFQNQRQGIQAD